MNRIVKAFLTGRMLCVFLYGISSGIPLLLIGSTLKAWMKEEGIDLTIIGIYSLVGLPYTLKFLWAPFLDRFVPPFLGRRRGWILITQALLFLALLFMASIKPTQSPYLLAFAAFIIAFLSATQDIAIDAYRRDVLKEEELGLGSSLAVNGYRIGLLLTGAFALALADALPWNEVYLIMSGLMAFCTTITLLSPEPKSQGTPPKDLMQAVILPFKDYFKRKHAYEILLFILLFKIGDSMASDMFNPFYLDMGYTKTQIAAIAKLFGFWATITGGIVGGMLMMQWGIERCLWIFGILQTFSTLGFSFLATVGQNLQVLTIVVVVENICTGMATSAYVGFMASLCNKRFTATQYALLSSLMGIPRVFFGSSSGYLAKNLGWSGYFLFCTLLHLPGLLLLLRKHHWVKPLDITQ
jgi:PAT family beta-lactamase induction signal transducer AmpG